MSEFVEQCKIAMQALSDWAATYASDMCDAETVAKAKQRIHQHGTLAYIDNATDHLQSVITALSEAEAALDEREIASGLTSNGNLWRFWADKAKGLAVKLSETEQRARREALEEAAILAGSIGDEQIRSGSLDLDASVDKIIVAIRALIPSEHHDTEGRETPRRGDPSIFDDAEGRN